MLVIMIPSAEQGRNSGLLHLSCEVHAGISQLRRDTWHNKLRLSTSTSSSTSSIMTSGVQRRCGWQKGVVDWFQASKTKQVESRKKQLEKMEAPCPVVA